MVKETITKNPFTYLTVDVKDDSIIIVKTDIQHNQHSAIELKKHEWEILRTIIDRNMPHWIIPDDMWKTERGKRIIAEAKKISDSIEEHLKNNKHCFGHFDKDSQECINCEVAVECYESNIGGNTLTLQHRGDIQ